MNGKSKILKPNRNSLNEITHDLGIFDSMNDLLKELDFFQFEFIYLFEI